MKKRKISYDMFDSLTQAQKDKILSDLATLLFNLDYEKITDAVISMSEEYSHRGEVTPLPILEARTRLGELINFSTTV